MKNISIKKQFLFYVITLLILGIGIFFSFSYENFKQKVDISQENIYSKKIDNIIYLIDEKNTKLQKTGMIEAYESSFKRGTLKSIKEVFAKENEKEFPFIINKKNLYILHKEFDKRNSVKYENNRYFKDILKLKNGSFEYVDTWLIFKNYKAWDWIIGYKVKKEKKYKELNQFKDNFLISAILFLIVISFIILFIVKRLLDPITKLTKATREIASGNFDTRIEVSGAKELKDLSSSFNIMRNKIISDIDKIKENDKKIKEFNKKLQIEVEERTIELQESNDELETSIENLRKAQNKLIESEKLAGLGGLIAGVAHEINTPVGIGLTGSSHLEFLNESINEKYKNDQMTQEDFEEYLKSSSDLVNVINSNLNRTADIIKNFKQVAVDQTSEQERIFRVKEYIRGVLVSIDSLTKKRDLEITLECDDSLEIVSYPGFFAQIITNLVANSVNHAYEEEDKGSISIVIRSSDTYLTIEYMDDGKGISKDNLSKIYEPFFSTNKEAGGSGLGLNIIYNLVTINLKGTIDCKSELGNGSIFKIKIPIQLSNR